MKLPKQRVITRCYVDVRAQTKEVNFQVATSIAHFIEERYNLCDIIVADCDKCIVIPSDREKLFSAEINVLMIMRDLRD